MPFLIRDEIPADATAIHVLNAAAFETDAEARLVDALRARGRLLLSLVAVEDGAVVGHIAARPVEAGATRTRDIGEADRSPPHRALARERSAGDERETWSRPEGPRAIRSPAFPSVSLPGAQM